MNIADAMIEAEEKAWRSLAGYKFWMFGYHAAQWVLLNRIGDGERMSNPFTRLVKAAREHVNQAYDKPPSTAGTLEETAQQGIAQQTFDAEFARPNPNSPGYI